MHKLVRDGKIRSNYMYFLRVENDGKNIMHVI